MTQLPKTQMMLAVLVAALGGSVATAQQTPSDPPNPDVYAPTQGLLDAADDQHASYERTLRQEKLKELHSEALQLKTRDGGTLTSDDQAYIQAKLRRIKGD